MPEYRNIYQTMRERAGLTQERAAERIALSVESLRQYELGRRRPSDETVCRMADVYGDPYLCYLHMQQSTLGGTILPEVEQRPLEQAAMRLFRLLRKFAIADRTEQLLTIAEDGIIDETEQPLFTEIMAELREIVRNALELSYCRPKQRKTPGAAATASERM